VIVKLPFLVADTDRHGNVRYYVRKKGQPKVRIRSEPDSVEFIEEYTRACEGKVARKVTLDRAAEGTFRWLCIKYFESVDFRQLGDSTGHVRRLILEGIAQSKNAKGNERGSLPYARMEERHIRDIRDEKSDFPEAANGRLKALRQLFRWAKTTGRIATNPAASVERLGSSSEGFHTWTEEEVAQFEARHPVGTKARLAFALLRYTGVRRSDVIKLGPGMEKDGALVFTITKGSKRKGRPGEAAPGPKRLALPILPQLRAILDQTPSKHMTYLVTEWGKPFTAPGFGNKFRDWCNEAGLRHCSAHGVRKFDATTAAENGATEHQLMAMFGWDSPKQAGVYTRKANRSKLAKGAMHLLAPENENEKV
jgi:integrase